MPSPRVLVLRSPGANCDEETAEAFRLAGGEPKRVHVNRLLEQPALLADYQVLCVPGGFSYGDDVAAGRVLGNQLRLTLGDALRAFRDAGNLALGVCNGFQVLIKTGLLDVADEDADAATNEAPLATLTWNDHGRYEARWVTLDATPGECVFLRGVRRIELPIAHAEGKVAVRDDAALATLRSNQQVVLSYADPAVGPTADESMLPFPHNPNGAIGNVAGLSDKTGRVLGLMPHPERFLYATQHPQWTRRRANEGADPHAEGDGLRLFRNAVEYFA